MIESYVHKLFLSRWCDDIKFYKSIFAFYVLIKLQAYDFLRVVRQCQKICTLNRALRWIHAKFLSKFMVWWRKKLTNLSNKFFRIAWQYPDRSYIESLTLHSNLKRTPSLTGDAYMNNCNFQQQYHVTHQYQLSCSETSAANFISSNTSTSPSQETTPTYDEPAPMVGTYPPNYTFPSIDTSTGNDVDYMNNSSLNTAQANSLNSTTSIGTHQRRGSLQLWQFLVALLDEPTSTYTIMNNFS